jgi:hypothetical protein
MFTNLVRPTQNCPQHITKVNYMDYLQLYTFLLHLICQMKTRWSACPVLVAVVHSKLHRQAMTCHSKLHRQAIDMSLETPPSSYDMSLETPPSSYWHVTRNSTVKLLTRHSKLHRQAIDISLETPPSSYWHVTRNSTVKLLTCQNVAGNKNKYCQRRDFRHLSIHQ